ncbi:MAG: transposase [bacterium]
MARVVVPDIPHHIIQRGNRRQRVFFSDEDRACYLALLADNARKNGVSIWAYCLMDNHVHMVAVPESEAALAKAIGDTHRGYTRRINFRENWRGYLWQGRFSSSPLDERHLFAAVRYVERNPVRARLVQHAEDYRWSSARAHVQGQTDICLSGDELGVLGIDDWKAYLMESGDDDFMKRLRKGARTGRPLGSDEFIDRIESLTGRVLRRQKPGPKGRN